MIILLKEITGIKGGHQISGENAPGMATKQRNDEVPVF